MILQKINNRCGFTLIEVLIVIAILAIAATVMIPLFYSILAGIQTDTQVEIIDQDEETAQPDVEEKQVEQKEESNTL